MRKLSRSVEAGLVVLHAGEPRTTELSWVRGRGARHAGKPWAVELFRMAERGALHAGKPRMGELPWITERGALYAGEPWMTGQCRADGCGRLRCDGMELRVSLNLVSDGAVRARKPNKSY